MVNTCIKWDIICTTEKGLNVDIKNNVVQVFCTELRSFSRKLILKILILESQSTFYVCIDMDARVMYICTLLFISYVYT